MQDGHPWSDQVRDKGGLTCDSYTRNRGLRWKHSQEQSEGSLDVRLAKNKQEAADTREGTGW